MASGASWGCNVEPGRTLLLALGLLLSAQVEPEDLPPLAYSAQPVRGVVVDATTGARLEGVIVVAQWILFQGGPYYSPDHIVRLQVLETVTDAHGQYVIPGWGPKPNTLYPWSQLDKKDPEMSFFKPGYTPRTVQNRWQRDDAVRFSEWDGKTIKLEKFKGTAEEWAREVSFLQTFLGWLSKDTDWRWMPRMVLALELERQRLDQLQPGTAGSGFGPSPLSSLGTTLEEVRRYWESQK